MSKTQVQTKLDVMEERLYELTDTIVSLEAQLNAAKDVISAHRWDATEIEIEDIHDTVKELREQLRILELDNNALRDSRDMFQSRNAELIRTVNGLKKKLK